ncbi:probable serine/threonine-protein kinase PBL19 isoform X2 [Dioscorea cayenensis subsp. rotundata]|nr:probable serine/threonine-protein kinase PBL19 isoform X2 [Dioscorea cayenensis subsp. rotundata]
MGCFSFLKGQHSGSKRSGRRESSPRQTTTPAQPSTSIASGSDGSAGGTQPPSKSSASTSSQRSITNMYEEKAQCLRVFGFDELRHATNDFSRLLKIGEGGFGSVYKGFIDLNGNGEKIPVAIKKLNQHGLQGHKQWLAEVQFLGVVEHPNLVKLIGYCGEDGERGIQRLLVYEFMANKSLEHHLFGRTLPPIPWKLRIKIVLGAAEGLAYLHEGLEIQVIYRDFKAANVLLDEEFNPKLSDFGLAREGPTDGRSHVSTAVVGTYGYAAPDYIETGHLTIKSDVWGFGVFLYEILTGRRTLERNRPTNEQKLLDWVKQFPPDARTFGVIIDPRLRHQFPIDAAREVAKLADRCLVKEAKLRPSMSNVVECLRHVLQLSEDFEASEQQRPKPSPTQSRNAKRTTNRA